MKYNKYILGLIAFAFLACATDGLYEDTWRYGKKLQIRDGMVLEKIDVDGLKSIDYLKIREEGFGLDNIFTPEEGEKIHEIFTDNKAEVSRNVYALTYYPNPRQKSPGATLTSILPASKEVEQYATGSLFERYHFSPDNKYIILYHGESQSITSQALFNRNEVAVIDLTSPPSEVNPKIFSIYLEGHVVNRIDFLEPVKIGEVKRQLVAFSANGLIRFVDFLDSDYPGITVNLKTENDNRKITPAKLQQVPAYNSYGPRVFVMASEVTELYDIEFIPDDNEAVGFRPSVNLFDHGTSYSNFTTVKDGGELLLVALARTSPKIDIFNVDTAAGFSISTNNALSNILERENGNELVLWNHSSNRIYFLETQNLAKAKGANLEHMNIPSGIAYSYVLDDNRLLVTNQQGSGFGMIDLRARILTNLESSAEISSQAQASLWKETFFLAKGSTISFLNIENGYSVDLVLDENVTSFHIFEAKGLGVAFHRSPTGRASIFPLEDPKREAVKIEDGFFVSNILNGREE